MPWTGLTFTINREQLRGYSEILVSTTRLPVAEQLIPQPSRHRSTALLQPLFVEFYDVGPRVH